MKLKEFELGYADATKEFMLQPQIFKEAFYDPNNTLEKLLDSWKYILAGRKGVGKSAFGSKIRYLSEIENNIWTKNLQLNDFEYSTFAKASCEGDTNGTKKYFDAWNFLILFQIYKTLYEEKGITEIDEFSRVVSLLSKMGFPINISFKTLVANISRLKLGANIGVFDAEYETEFGYKPISFVERMSSITEKMKLVLKEVYVNKKLYLLIDGVDDILRIKKNQVEILSSMLRSIDSINSYFFEEKIDIKIILFIREDILSMIVDPDINKIKRDALIALSWNDNTDGLLEIVELRLKLSGHGEGQWWNKIFPNKIRDKASWKEILDHTMYKPRDILQFLHICQTWYPDNEKLSFSETNRALKIYSRDYFIEEMKNELSGYIDDRIIGVLPAVFQRTGSRAFSVSDIKRAIEQQLIGENIGDSDIKQLLLVLFEAGYIGQLVKGNRGKESVIFKYRNPGANVDYMERFLVHKGIQKGLGVIL